MLFLIGLAAIVLGFLILDTHLIGGYQKVKSFAKSEWHRLREDYPWINARNARNILGVVSLVGGVGYLIILNGIQPVHDDQVKGALGILTYPDRDGGKVLFHSSNDDRTRVVYTVYGVDPVDSNKRVPITAVCTSQFYAAPACSPSSSPWLESRLPKAN